MDSSNSENSGLPNALSEFDTLRSSVEKVTHIDYKTLTRNLAGHLQRLHSLTRPEQHLDAAFGEVERKVGVLLGAIKAIGSTSIAEHPSVTASRAEALAALSKLRTLLLAARPSDEATAQGLSW